MMGEVTEEDILTPIPEKDVRYMQNICYAIVGKDITGLNLRERRAVARHVLREEGYDPWAIRVMVEWPTPILRKYGFKGKAR